MVMLYILTLKFACLDMHFAFFYLGLEKNLNSSLSFGQATLTFSLPRAMATCGVACLKTHAHRGLNLFNV